jgi:serine/threonine protein kinase
MTSTVSCAKCGYQSATDAEQSAKCPKCGTPKSSAASLNLATLIEAPLPSANGSTGRPSSSSRFQSVLPKSIDGYEILSLLGSGGMGTVFLAYEPLLDRTVALKLLARHSDDDVRSRSVARFLSESVLTGKLGHAGIIPIYRVGFDPEYGYYYVMRYVKGQSLLEQMHQLSLRRAENAHALSLTRLLTIFLRVCEAIAFAHRHGVIHRDIKPANIMLAEFGEVLVLDWGLAKGAPETESVDTSSPDAGETLAVKLAEARKRRNGVTQMFLSRDRNPQARNGTSLLKQLQASKRDATPGRVTQADQILGTPGYLSPEQGSGLSATAASDVYSLGVMLYEMLTHRLPIDGDDVHHLIAKTVLGEIVPIEQRPESARIPKALCAIVTRALSVKPEERFKDAAELAEEITLYLDGRAAWKSLAQDKMCGTELWENWLSLAGKPLPSDEGLCLTAGTRLRCTRAATGDFKAAFEFWPQMAAPWSLAVGVAEIQSDKTVASRYEFRIGVDDRPYIELLRNGHRIQRRLDVRLQTNQCYKLKIEMEDGTLHLFLENKKYIEYQESFPQIGGVLEVSAPQGSIGMREFSLESRGAPLNLSFMVLPDRLYRSGKYGEARELYRQLADSHPDREEGMIARYKTGLCSTAMGETQNAFEEFTRLEGTMYDHCCALGLAQIGMRDGNIEWAWEALKNGYARYPIESVRNEIWLSMLGLIESVGKERTVEKIERYRELIRDLNPDPQETGRITCDLLECIQFAQGIPALRNEAARLLKEFPENVFLVQEALLALSRVGIDTTSTALVSSALDCAMRQRCPESILSRFHILRAETCIAEGKNDDAFSELRNVITTSGMNTSEGLWAKAWQTFIHYLNGKHMQALTDAHEILARVRRLRVAQVAYFQLIEGLCYLGKNQANRADVAFQSGATNEGLWGLTAQHIVARQRPAELIRQAAKSAANQLSEALFITAEAHRLRGELELANLHYEECLKPEHERAMFVRIVKQRMEMLANSAG